MDLLLKGRRVIKTDESEITSENVVSVLRKALELHYRNRNEIQYLWNYYRGDQPILNRIKEVRPEICNMIVENRAAEIVQFKSGYLMGEPIQYVSRGDDTITDALNTLNEYVFAEEKASKDKELSDWFHICGTSYRMILPDPDGDEDESPFEIYTLDPRNAFVVYHNGLGNKPVLGVKYVVDDKGVTHFTCYSKTEYWEITDGSDVPVEHGYHILGDVPIIEYPLNMERIGAFEVVIPLLDAINMVDSNRVDGLEQFIQALLLFHNVDISADDFEKLKDLGGIKFKDVDPTMKGEITYLTAQLSQGETQTLVDHMYDTVLTITGMPNRNGGSSTSDTGSAVIFRDGWSSAESRAKNAELMFKKSERKMLKIMLNICEAIGDVSLKVKNIEIRFTRRNYENILQKAQVLTMMLGSDKIHPKLAFEHSGMFVDADLAYALSEEYAKEQERKAKEMMENAAKLNPADDPADRSNPSEGETSRSDDRTGKSNGGGDNKKTEV